MIWGAISGNGLGILHHIDGTLTADKYAHILDHYVRESFKQFRKSLDFYQEDNDPKHGGPHGARIVRDWFKDNPDIIRLN